MRKHGLVELFFTSDNEGGLVTGSVPDTLRTINLQEGARNLLAYLRSAQPDKPLMVAEFWTGWYDHWTEAHNTYDASRVTASLRELLSAGASVNLYMFHGGTNFGFMNGANDGPNHDQVYKPDITRSLNEITAVRLTLCSYDYDALLTETGEITTKYLQVKALLSEFFPTPPLGISTSLITSANRHNHRSITTQHESCSPPPNQTDGNAWLNMLFLSF